MKTCGQCQHFSLSTWQCQFGSTGPLPMWARKVLDGLGSYLNPEYAADTCDVYEERQKAELTTAAESVTVKS